MAIIILPVLLIFVEFLKQQYNSVSIYYVLIVLPNDDVHYGDSTWRFSKRKFIHSFFRF